jgi:hypothetical protein
MKRALALAPERVLHRPLDTASGKPVALGSTRWKQFAAAVCVIAAAVTAVSIYNARQTSIAAKESRGRLTPFETSQPLRPGDTVIVHRLGESSVRHVAGGANEAVLLKRGNALQGLYMAGKGSYVVISGGDTRIVRAKDITATVTPPGERPR